MKHKLKPLKDKEEKVSSTARIFFVDGKEFLKGMKCDYVCNFIIPKDSKEEVEEVPAEVVDILGEFFDIVSHNVPDRLPPNEEDQSLDGFGSRSQFSKQDSAQNDTNRK